MSSDNNSLGIIWYSGDLILEAAPPAPGKALFAIQACFSAIEHRISPIVFSYCLVAIVHHKMKLKISVYNTLQVLGISLTDTTPLEDLFNKSNLNIDKELDGFYEPTLFDD